jgi:hypothetical protein
VSQVAGRLSQVGSQVSQVASRRSQVGSRSSQVASRRCQVGGRASQVAGRLPQVGGRASQVAGRTLVGFSLGVNEGGAAVPVTNCRSVRVGRRWSVSGPLWPIQNLTPSANGSTIVLDQQQNAVPRWY